MRALLWLLVLAALAAGLSLAATHNSGYALLVLPPWRVELSLNLLFILGGVAFLFLHVLVRSLGTLLTLPASVREYRQRRRREYADAFLREAVVMMLEGRFGRALRLAEQSYEAGHAVELSALVALRAAHGMRDTERISLWRDRSRQGEGENSVARLMSEAEMAAEARDFVAARELLEQLARGAGRHVAAQRLALRVYQGLGQWREVDHTLRQLEKHHAITPQQAAPLRHRAQREMLTQLRDHAMPGGKLERFLRELPESDRLQPRLVLSAVPMLAAAGNHAEAARLIEDALDARWDGDLAAAYGDCEGNALSRIAHAEQWLQAHPRDAKLLLTLGRLCRRQQLWGKAQSYLEASLSVQPSRWAHLELAALHDHLDKPEKANAHYRAAAGG